MKLTWTVLALIIAACAREVAQAPPSQLAVVGPRILSGAEITVSGSAGQRWAMTLLLPDGRVQGRGDIAFRGPGAVVSVNQPGCQPLRRHVKASTQKQTVEFSSNEVKCQGVVGGVVATPDRPPN